MITRERGVLLRGVAPVGDARGGEHAPEAVAGVGVVMSGLAGDERGVVPAEDEPQSGLQQVGDHGVPVAEVERAVSMVRTRSASGPMRSAVS